MARSHLLSRREYALEEPAINLTPLIDVVFVILIMFILIAPLLEVDQVELAEASHSSALAHAVQETSPLAIHVREDNTIWFNHQPVTPKQLTEQLKQAKIVHPKAHPQVFHDRKAQFGTYQAIKNAAEEAGFSELEIILKPS